ncbi:MAG: tRNA pseudouridine(38-40) synthase TruA [Anaerolineales bacterium]|nr:tRNA pseudouridine(38-40) synthase TruA [Anaerolineales bacterium]MCX7608864.1 tRNA pseudouridine(38-40) synthase TruA [Anaerolineales bacterium]MDW8226295.1 tRNA pseudouridine(38-40) synthase TruA [Anaerolineales bacterium]
MARYQIILAYDGTGFAGSQRQGKARTVQSELEKALRSLGWTGTSVLMAGRTDAGVHALGQVAAFDLAWRHSLSELRNALNATLPSDMAVRQVICTTDEFHPRFDARSRRYRYRLFCREVRDPLQERYAWRVWPPVTDLTPLASLWIGTHDFAAFGSPTSPKGRTVRTVFDATWQQQEESWTFEIEADAFLYRMVRRLVFLQVAVGQGRLSSEALRQTLEHPEAGTLLLPGGLAPAAGLTLIEVKYDLEIE